MSGVVLKDYGGLPDDEDPSVERDALDDSTQLVWRSRVGSDGAQVFEPTKVK